MFKIVQNPEFSHVVHVQVPVDSGHATQTFTARFRVLTVSQAGAHRLDTAEGTDAYLRDIFVGWGKDLTDSDGAPLDYSDQIRDQLIDQPHVRLALLKTYNAALQGAKRGN